MAGLTLKKLRKYTNDDGTFIYYEKFKELLLNKQSVIKTTNGQSIIIVKINDKNGKEIGINGLNEYFVKNSTLINENYSKNIVFIDSKNNEWKLNEFLTTNVTTIDRTLNNKDFTPQQLGLTYSSYKSISKFDSDVHHALSISKRPIEAVTFCKNLYNLVATTRNTNKTIKTRYMKFKIDKVELIIPYSKQIIELKNSLYQKDINIIGKNFGEVLAMRWCLSRKKYYNYVGFNFPVAANEPLVDAYIFTKNTNERSVKNKLSVKYKTGAAASIASLSPNINESDFDNQPHLKVKAIILKNFDSDKYKSKESGTSSDKFLKTYYLLNSNNKIIDNKKFSSTKELNEFIENLLKTEKTDKHKINKFNKTFNNFFKFINHYPSDNSIKSILLRQHNSSQYFNLICGPLANYLVDILNNDNDFTHILNFYGKKNQIDQIYVNFDSNSISFKSKEFADNEFKFSYNGSAISANRSNIKFEMV